MTDPLVILADDHPMVRAALREAVRTALPSTQFRECSNFDDLTVLFAQEREVDLLLLDLNMPGMHGFVGLMSVVANWPLVPAIMVSATETVDVIQQARTCGASGFIPKSAPVETIGQAVQCVMAGQTWFPPARKPAPAPSPPLQALSRTLAGLPPQQLRVLQMVMEGRLNKQIAGDLGLAEQTVKGHVSAILRKFNAGNRTQVVIALSPLLAKEDQGG